MRGRGVRWRQAAWAAALVWAVALGGYWVSHRDGGPPVWSVETAASQVDSTATLVPEPYPPAAVGTVAWTGAPAPSLTLEVRAATAGRRVVSVGPVPGHVTVLALLPRTATRGEAAALGQALRNVGNAGSDSVPVARVAVSLASMGARSLGPGWRVWSASGTRLVGLGGYGLPSRLSGPPVVFVLTPGGRMAYMGVVNNSAAAAGIASDLRALERTAHAGLADARSKATGPGSFVLDAIEPGGAMGRVRVGEGGGPTLVDFFATWCHACHADMAVLKAYSRLRTKASLPPVVAVDLRLAEPSTAYVKAFVHREGLPFPVALDSTGEVTDAYRVAQIPVLALVSGRGTILWTHVGVVTQAQLVHAVRTALAELG